METNLAIEPIIQFTHGSSSSLMDDEGLLFTEIAMLNLLETTIKPLMLNQRVLKVAYELYLQAPDSVYPLINLKELSCRTSASLLECCNAIVEAHSLGRFPRCALDS